MWLRFSGKSQTFKFLDEQFLAPMGVRATISVLSLIVADWAKLLGSIGP